MVKKISPTNWLFLAIIASLAIMWGIERWNGNKAHRELKKHYEDEFKRKEEHILRNEFFIDSVTTSSKKKDLIIDSLDGVISESQAKVIYIEKKSDEKIDVIRGASRDSTRSIFTGG